MARAISVETYRLRDELYAYLLDVAVVSWDHFYPILTLVALEALAETTDAYADALDNECSNVYYVESHDGAGARVKGILQQYIKEMVHGGDSV